jgi:hypothetical protein
MRIDPFTAIRARAEYRPEHHRFAREQSQYSRDFCEWETDSMAWVIWTKDFLSGLAWGLAIFGTWFLVAHLSHYCTVLKVCAP